MTHAEIRRLLAQETDPARRRHLEWLLDRGIDGDVYSDALVRGTISAPDNEVVERQNQRTEVF